MIPTFILLGLIFGIVLAFKPNPLAAVCAVVAAASAALLTIFGDDVDPGWETVGSALLIFVNLAVGSAVGLASRRLVRSRRPS